MYGGSYPLNRLRFGATTVRPSWSLKPWLAAYLKLYLKPLETVFRPPETLKQIGTERDAVAQASRRSVLSSKSSTF